MIKKCIPYLPLCIIAIAIAIFYFSNLRHEITFETIQADHEKWKEYARDYPFISALVFILALLFSAVFIIPGSMILGLLGGFLFPFPLAMLYFVIGETLGAYLFYEAVGLALIPPLHRKKNSFFWKLEKKILPNQISFLLFFRFTHLLPFWVINAAAACFEVRRWTFLWTTCVGMIPLAYLLAEGGAGLGSYFETHTTFSIEGIFNTQFKLALLVLGALALLPIFWKALRRKK